MPVGDNFIPAEQWPAILAEWTAIFREVFEWECPFARFLKAGPHYGPVSLVKAETRPLSRWRRARVEP